MSARELERAAVFARVVAETLTLRSAAAILAMSYRQAKRLCRRYRAEGARGMRHRSVGRASNRARATPERTRALALIREKYSGPTAERFGPTLAAEHLASEDGVVVDHETLRRWMLADGLWSRARKRSPHRRRRERMAHFGELVQLDGSFHPWFERRGPQSCQLTLVDDATGRSFGRFGAQETIWAAVSVLRTWIERHGIPRALYTDWKNVYVRRPNAEERLTGAEPLTQFGRMCATLGIAIIPASSPQAKGRIERHHGTHQDRLVKKLRRHGIADLDAANGFLEDAYWAEHNQRFAQSPASAEDFHPAVPRRVSLDEVFRLVETRTVSNDWVVRYANRHLQIERQTHQPPARGIVQVLENAAGQLEIHYRGRRMRWSLLDAPRPSPAAPPRIVPPATMPAAKRRNGQAPDHPWHHVVDAHRSSLAFRKDRRAWERVQPDLEPGTFVTSEDRGHF